MLTQRIDPQAQQRHWTTNIQISTATGYVFRLKYVVDPDGRTNTLLYTSTSNPWTLKEIDDPFGRKAAFSYNTSNWLTSITDAAGNSNAFGYTTNNAKIVPNSSGWLTNIITGYGTTTFYNYQNTESNVAAMGFRTTLFASLNQPERSNSTPIFTTRRASSKQAPRLQLCRNSEFDSGTNSNADGDQGLYHRNSFYWNREQTPNLGNFSELPRNLGSVITSGLSANDFYKARMRHWLLGGDGISITEALSSERDPSPNLGGTIEGNRTWIAYTNSNATDIAEAVSSQISATAQVLPDGTTQYSYYQYAPSGYVSTNKMTFTKTDGTVGLLTNWFSYAANGIDLTTLSNSMGQFVNLGYNANHEVTFITNALNYVSSNGYDSGTHNLTSVTFSSGQTINLTYYSPSASTNDACFLNTVTVEPENQTTTIADYASALPHIIDVAGTGVPNLWVTNTWDALNRLTGTTFQDDTTISNVYINLSRSASKDRLGYWTYYGYDGLEHLTSITNALTNVTTLTWCSCGSLTGITDSLSNTTTIDHNNQGLVTNIVFPDGSSLTNQYDLSPADQPH